MTPRRRLLLFGLLAGSLALGAGLWLLWPRSAITRENAAKIQEEMTLAEVEAILGGPERDDSSGPLCEVESGEAGRLGAGWYKSARRGQRRKAWGSNEVIVILDVADDRLLPFLPVIPVRRDSENL